MLTVLNKYNNNDFVQHLSQSIGRKMMFFLKQVKKCKFNFTRLLGVDTQRFRHIRWKSEVSDVINLEIRGRSIKYPLVWLRDNCQCDKCFHTSAKSRIFEWSKFDIDPIAKEVVNADNCLKITWKDGHVSQYSLNWLEIRGFDEKNKNIYEESIYRPKKILWSGENFKDICSRHDYKDILNSDKALYNWLNMLAVYGVALIQNTPNIVNAIDNIVDKIGFTKPTHYGVKFVVQHVTDTNNVAYLSHNLQMHTDLPYYEYGPGVNLLHCLVQTQSSGGANLLSDGHYVANFMKNHHTKEYSLLTEVDVEWSDVGVADNNEFFKLYRLPIISLDRYGDIKRISFSIPQRGSHFPGSIELVKPWYEAYGLFLKLNTKFSANIKTKSGDILVFDNSRLLHGRNAYEDNVNNVRKLIGAYLDWDEIYSRLRCLKKKLHNVDGI